MKGVLVRKSLLFMLVQKFKPFIYPVSLIHQALKRYPNELCWKYCNKMKNHFKKTQKFDAIILIYGSGGHREQMKRIILGINENKISPNLVSICDSNVQNPLTLNCYRNLEIKKEYFLIFKLPLAFFIAIVHFIKIRLKYKEIQTVICTGPGIGIVYLFLFKIFNIKTIFLESWSRFSTKSFTGRLVYPLANVFIVQNEEGLKHYPKSKFLEGRL